MTSDEEMMFNLSLIHNQLQRLKIWEFIAEVNSDIAMVGVGSIVGYTSHTYNRIHNIENSSYRCADLTSAQCQPIEFKLRALNALGMDPTSISLLLSTVIVEEYKQAKLDPLGSNMSKFVTDEYLNNLLDETIDWHLKQRNIEVGDSGHTSVEKILELHNLRSKIRNLRLRNIIIEECVSYVKSIHGDATGVPLPLGMDKSTGLMIYGVYIDRRKGIFKEFLTRGPLSQDALSLDTRQVVQEYDDATRQVQLKVKPHLV